MQVRLLSWEYENIRGVKNLKVSVESNVNTPYRTSLIMMRNGTGKTTTLKLLRAIFDGKAVQWEPNEVKGLKPPGSISDEGVFKATLLIDDVIYIVFIKLNYLQGTVGYQTSRVASAGGGLENGHNLPSSISLFFTENFVKRFIFDGELARKIFESKSNEAENAIKFLYHLNKLEDIQTKVQGIVDQAQQRVSKSSSQAEQKLQRQNTEKVKYETALRTLKLDFENVDRDLTAKIERRVIVEKEISEFLKANEQLRERAIVVEKEKKEFGFQVKQKSQYILSEIRDPFKVSLKSSESLINLSRRMQSLKLPRTMSKQFFEELAEHPECICGHKIGVKEKENILRKANDFLADDQIGVINAVKSAIRGRAHDDSVSHDILELADSISKRNLAKAEWDRLQTKLGEMGSDNEQELLSEKAKLDKDIPYLKERLKKLITTDESEHKLFGLDGLNNIPLCEAKLRGVHEKIAETTGTLELIRKSDKLSQYLKRIQLEASMIIKNKIKEKTNAKLEAIIRTESVAIEDIEGHLVLQGKDGVSEGQSLAIAYSFLGSMFESSSHELPFVVDSPAGSLDLDVRREVSRILPNLFKQLIIFITSGERQGFTEYFLDSDSDIQFLTIIRSDSHETKCLEGKDVFRSYQESANLIEVN